jgi:phosphatidylinositol-3-phosphatase
MPAFQPHPLRRRASGALAAFAALVLSAAVAPIFAQRAAMPPIHHVFLLVLENEGYDTTFKSPSPAPYLADTLRKAGALLTQYHGTGHLSLDNYISMISGMPPTRETQLDCRVYLDFVETGISPDGQPIGSGCVYPAHVPTIANQLEAKGLTWKGFMEDMGKDAGRESSTCAHPAIGASDTTRLATPTDNYATKHNPFMYFHAVIDSATCQRNVVPLPELETALRSADQTPNYSFITPGLCHDGHDRPCKSGEPGGLESANAFLEHWVPLITNSPAFRADGLLIITFDESLGIDATACCNEASGPNTPKAGINGPGGGRIGAVLLSPFIKPGTVSHTGYNHYSMLRTVEDIFSLAHIGYAGEKGLATFGSDVFTRPHGP